MPGGLPERVRAWRERVGAEGGVIVAGGVAGPADAVALVEAGASLVLVDAGLVFNGPGLVKRCNAALLGRRVPAVGVEADFSVMRWSWFWAAALGLALAGCRSGACCCLTTSGFWGSRRMCCGGIRRSCMRSWRMIAARWRA
jgi:hypothetical protein